MHALRDAIGRIRFGRDAKPRLTGSRRNGAVPHRNYHEARDTWLRQIAGALHASRALAERLEGAGHAPAELDPVRRRIANALDEVESLRTGK